MAQGDGDQGIAFLDSVAGDCSRGWSNQLPCRNDQSLTGVDERRVVDVVGSYDGADSRPVAIGNGIQGIAFLHGVIGRGAGRGRGKGRPACGDDQPLTCVDTIGIGQVIGLDDGCYRGAIASCQGVQGIAPLHDVHFPSGLDRGCPLDDAGTQNQRCQKQGQNRQSVQISFHLVPPFSERHG